MARQTGMAVAAVLIVATVLAVRSSAQSSSIADPPPQSAASSGRGPLQHLDAARVLLDQIRERERSLPEEKRRKISNIRKLFSDMADLYRVAPDGSHVPDHLAGEQRRDLPPDDWRALFSEIERELTYQIGGAPLDRSNRSDASINAEGIEQSLERFRLELELFYASALTDGGA